MERASMIGNARSPYEFESLATEAEAREDWAAAAEYWRDAGGVTLGHSRRERYYAAQMRCWKLAGK